MNVRKKENSFRRNIEEIKKLEREFGGALTYTNILQTWLPTNLSYLINCKYSDFYVNVRDIKIEKHKTSPVFVVPKIFSIIDNPKESFGFIRKVMINLLCEKSKILKLDYSKCEQLSIGAQVLLDIILNDAIQFYRKCFRHKSIERIVEITKDGYELANPEKTALNNRKILSSVGSLAIHGKMSKFSDVVSYPLCIHSREGNYDKIKASERKDIDTTTLADYVIQSLAKVNKKLSPEKLDSLCTIIGEILINAEEHSTTKHRFSIGYFQDSVKNGKHFGMFRLVIMNFGKTIYEKFKDPDCPNKDVVKKMKKLSENYTKKGLFNWNSFDEETLWTLYALQEGVTSVSDKKRGNGSIQFIDNFFNIKGVSDNLEEKSRMVILSGNTSITFDGTYRINDKKLGGEKFKVMTFNQSGNIEDKPDEKFVKHTENYFPGTMISARIYFNEDDYDAT